MKKDLVMCEDCRQRLTLVGRGVKEHPVVGDRCVVCRRVLTDVGKPPLSRPNWVRSTAVDEMRRSLCPIP